MNTDPRGVRIDRRRFLRNVSGSTLGLAFSGPLAALAAACSSDDDLPATASPEVDVEEGAIVGDVIDYALTSDDWEGEFGHVTMRLHRAAVDGADAWFVRTDASDEDYATQHELVIEPRMRPLVAAGLTGAAFYFEDADEDQPVVLSTEPGRDDYTPAFEVHRVTGFAPLRGRPDGIAWGPGRGRRR